MNVLRAGGRKAFTLIELLMVLLLLGTVMTVIIACFDGGFRVYARVSAFGISETEAYLAGEMVERDLKNAIPVRSVPFKGESSGMEFATVLNGQADSDGGPGVVRYRSTPESGIIRSAARLRAGDAAPAAVAEDEQLLAGDYALTLQYLGDRTDAGAGGSQDGWVDMWPGETNLPRAVRITISGGLLTEGPVVRTVALNVAEGESP